MNRCTRKVTMSSETSWLFHGLSYCLLSPLIKSRLSPARQVLPIVPGKSFILFVLCKFAGNGRRHPVQRGKRCYRASSICENHKSNSIWGSLYQFIRSVFSWHENKQKVEELNKKQLWEANFMRKEKNSVLWCNGKIVERKNKYQNQNMQAETEKKKSESWQSNKFTVNSFWGWQLPLSAHKHSTA